jgi:GNAT superfamily N-acetyltransferase
MASTVTPVIRRAVEQDAPAVQALVDALADYEKLARPDQQARARLVRDLFGPRPRVECHLAFMDGYPVGYTMFFETYSSFLALPTLYLEDLFVLPEYRGRRIGYALFDAALDEAKRRRCGRMEWTVLDWNQLAIDFYRKLGAKHMKEWQLHRISLV